MRARPFYSDVEPWWSRVRAKILPGCALARAGAETYDEVTLEVGYEVPVLGRRAEGMVGRVHQREAQTLLDRLKRALEA